MTRTRDWIKFGGLVAIAITLALAFAAAMNFPERSVMAQQRGPTLLPANQPAPIPAMRGLASLSDAFAASADVVRPTVVYISSVEHEQPRQQLQSPFDQFFPQQRGGPRERRGSGSGFIISPDGYIMTNNHVVEGADRLEVKLFDKRTFRATVVGRDPDTDIAVIHIDAHGLAAVSLGNSDSVRVGEWVLAVGNPLGEAFSFTVTAGIVSAKGRLLDGLRNGRYSIQDFIQTDAAINPGNSGGPLVNTRGQIIGINAAIASETGFYQGYGFAIPINLARSVAEQLIHDGHVTRAVLGISIDNASAEDAQAVGLDSIRGVLVLDATAEDSPAKRAGIQPLDVITAIDGQQVEYMAQLQQIVRFKKPGDKVAVTIQRKGGEKHTYSVTLAAGQAETERVAAAKTGKPEKPASFSERKLGISVEQLTATEAARSGGIGADHAGLVVADVDPDGPAASKLVPWQPGEGGDIITNVNGQRVRTEGDLADALRGSKPGDIVELQLYRVIRGIEPATRFLRMRVAGGSGN
jgi:serine protease Do